MSKVLYQICRPEVIDERFEDEYVIVNLKTGAYYSLNTSAAALWDVLESVPSRPEIDAYFGARYEGDTIEMQTHISRLLEELENEELVKSGEMNGSASAPGASTSEAPLTRTPFLVPTLEKYTDMQALLMLDPIHQVDNSGWPSKLDNAR